MTTLSAVLLGAVILIVIWSAVAYNRLVGRWERTREAWSGIDVQLRRRASQTSLHLRIERAQPRAR